VPDFVKTLSGTPQFKTNSFESSKFWSHFDLVSNRFIWE